ncbi:MAG: PKD domain-containing protein [Verrucomicrobia bacterium]|nr:PKD domain-containing protein [Verrucomicrobiota bacterium]
MTALFTFESGARVRRCAVNRSTSVAGSVVSSVCVRWSRLLLLLGVVGWFSGRAQTLGPIVTIPIEKVREHYYHPAEDGTGKSCGVRLYGEWTAYRNYTNRSSYRIFTPGLQSIPGPQAFVEPGGRFRFYCYFNGISTPFNDSVCPDKIGESLPDWYVEVQRRGPSANFSSRTLPPDPGQFEFKSNSTDPEGESVVESWNFGDGSSGAGVSPVHRFTKPGPFLVSLTVTDTDALTNRTQRTITVPAPKPSVSIQLLNKHSRNRLELGEEFRVRVGVEAGTTGVGELTGLAFAAAPLSIPEIFTVVSAPAQTEIGTLQPGERREFFWTLRADRAGEFALTASGVFGKDAIGRLVSAAPASTRGEVTSLIIGIVQRPAKVVLGGDNNQDGETNSLDRRVELIVGITNVSQQDVTGVRALIVEDPIQLTSLAEDLNIWLEPREVPLGEFGTIRPGAANAVLRTNVYEATDRTYAEASIVVQGKVGEAGVQTRGEGLVDIGGETLIEARFDLEDREYRSGQVVRVFGKIKNVSRFKNSRGEVIDEGKTVGVVVYPTTEGNGIGGYPFVKDSGGRTPEGPTAFLLAPDEEIEIGAIIPTAEVNTNSTVAITYQVAGFVHGEGSKPRRARPSEIEVVERVTEGWSARHQVDLAAVVETTDPWLICPTDLSFAGFVSCRFTEGLGNAGGGLVGLALLTGSGLKEIGLGSVRLIGWSLWAMEQTLDGLKDPAARARLAAEVAIDLQALQDVGVESLQGIQLAAAGIGPAIERAIIDTGRTLESGDLKQIAGGLARVTGENIDLPLEALVAARALRKAMLVREGAESAAKQALEESFERQARELGTTVDDYAARGDLAKLPDSDDLPTGLNVVNEPRVYRDAYGARTEDVKGFLQVAKEEGVILAFRSRSPRAAALLDAVPLKHLLKPHGVSIKTVSEIDVKYLNYPPQLEAECALVEPPFDWVNPWADKKNGVVNPDFDALANNYLSRYPELNTGTEQAQALRAQVYERLKFQMEEYPKQAGNFLKYSREGIDVNFHAQKQNLGFGKFLLPNKEAKRAARLEPHHFTDPYTGQPRVAYRLLMDDGAGSFKAITGDVDFLGIFNPDGSQPSLLKRIRVYRKMIALGMQHGESFTFFAKDLREKFLRCCTPTASGGEGEKMLAATPYGELLTTQFRDQLSVIEGGPNAALKVGKGEFAFLDGAMSEVNTLERAASDALPQALRNDVAPLVTVSALERLGEELKAEAARNGGQAVRLGPDGQPEIYDEQPDGNSPSPSVLSSHRRTGSVFPGNSVRPASETVEDELLGILDGLVEAGWVNAREPGTTGASGGRWRPATVDELHGGPTGKSLKLSPYTYLTNDVAAGMAVLPVLPASDVGWPAGQPIFAVGDRVVIDPGGPAEEFASVASIFPFTLSRPLQNGQEAGAMVLFLAGVTESAKVPGALPARENLLVWLRADAGLELDGTNVVSWTDQSPNRFVFRPSAVTTRPAWVANSTSGVPALRFNSSSTPRLHGNLGRTLTNATIFTLARYLNNSSGGRYIYAFGTINFSGLMMTLGRVGGDDTYHYDGAAERSAPGTIPGTGFRVFSQVFGEDGPDRHRLAVDGRTVIESRTTVGRAYSAVATNVVLGKYVTATFGFTGDLTEWIVYDRVLTPAERFEVEEYLRQRAALAPFVPPGSRDLSQSDLLSLAVPPVAGAAWKLDAANREAIPNQVTGPSLLLTGPGISNQVVRTHVRPAPGDGTFGVVFGQQDAGWFQLLDWRAVATNDPVLGPLGPGMTLRTVHLPEGEAVVGADLGATPDPSRATIWRTNAIPWIAGRDYEVVLNLRTSELVLEVNHAGTNLVTWTVPELAGVNGRVGHYAVAAPNARFGPLDLPAAGPVITHLGSLPDGRWRLDWVDGEGPYVIESRPHLGTSDWLPVGPATVNQNVLLPGVEDSALFRVRSPENTPP